MLCESPGGCPWHRVAIPQDVSAGERLRIVCGLFQLRRAVVALDAPVGLFRGFVEPQPRAPVGGTGLDSY